jgi:hypothetical protein
MARYGPDPLTRPDYAVHDVVAHLAGGAHHHKLSSTFVE